MTRIERLHRWWNRHGFWHVHRWDWIGGCVLSDGQHNYFIRVWCRDCSKERL